MITKEQVAQIVQGVTNVREFWAMLQSKYPNTDKKVLLDHWGNAVTVMEAANLPLPHEDSAAVILRYIDTQLNGS